jgi:cytoskeletal protein RodZ
MNPAKYEDSEEEREVFLPVSQPRDGHSSPERKRPRKTTWYLRLLLEVVMAITIIGLLLKPSLPYQWAANTEPSTPVPMSMSTSSFTFWENVMAES